MKSGYTLPARRSTESRAARSEPRLLHQRRRPHRRASSLRILSDPKTKKVLLVGPSNLLGPAVYGEWMLRGHDLTRVSRSGGVGSGSFGSWRLDATNAQQFRHYLTGCVRRLLSILIGCHSTARAMLRHGSTLVSTRCAPSLLSAENKAWIASSSPAALRFTTQNRRVPEARQTT